MSTRSKSSRRAGNDFLRDEGIYDEIHAVALKEVFAAELRSEPRSSTRSSSVVIGWPSPSARRRVGRSLELREQEID